MAGRSQGLSSGIRDKTRLDGASFAKGFGGQGRFAGGGVPYGF
jgi:hypothetical protein